MIVSSFVEQFHAWLAAVVAYTGPYAPLVLMLASFTEHVFPPFPGDVLVLLGAWYAVQGELSWPVTFLSVTTGAVVGAGLDWRIGWWLGDRLERSVEVQTPFVQTLFGGKLSRESLAAFEARYRRWGPLLLVANRFVPGLRAFVFLGAGASRVPLRDVLLYGGLSAAVWNGALLAAGAFLAHNVEELVGLLQRYTRGMTVVLVVAILAWTGWRVAARFARRRGTG